MSDIVKHEQSAMAVVFCQGSVLCTVEEIYGREVLSLPKGHIEQGETPLQTAIRECREETGIELSPECFVAQLPEYNVDFVNLSNQAVRKTHYPVLFKLDKTQAPCITEARVKSVRFMNVDEFVRQCTYDNVRNLIKDILQKGMLN